MIGRPVVNAGFHFPLLLVQWRNVASPELAFFTIPPFFWRQLRNRSFCFLPLGRISCLLFLGYLIFPFMRNFDFLTSLGFMAARRGRPCLRGALGKCPLMCDGSQVADTQRVHVILACTYVTLHLNALSVQSVTSKCICKRMICHTAIFLSLMKLWQKQDKRYLSSPDMFVDSLSNREKDSLK